MPKDASVAKERILKALKPFNLASADAEKAANRIQTNLSQMAARHDFTDYDKFLNFKLKIDALAAAFSNEEPDVEKFVNAAVKEPHLFCTAPVTLRNNIHNLVNKFKNEGLTLKNYVKAALKQPQLFCLSPDRVEANIRDLVKKFTNDTPPVDLTVEKHLKAALQNPGLFAQSPDTIENHIRYFFKLADDGILTGLDTTNQNPHEAVLNKLLTGYPTALSLSSNNIATRHALYLIQNEPQSLYQVARTTKTKITKALTACVSSLDHPLPNPEETPSTVIFASSVDAKKVRGERMLVELAQREALDPALNALVLSKVAPAPTR